MRPMFIEVTSTAHYLDVAKVPFRTATGQRYLMMAFEPAAFSAPCALPIGALDAETPEAFPMVATAAIATHAAPLYTPVVTRFAR